MADNETVVRDVQWHRVLSVGHLLKTFRIALWPPSKLLLCLAAIVVTISLGAILDQFFDTNVSGQSFCKNTTDLYRVATGYTITEARYEVWPGEGRGAVEKISLTKTAPDGEGLTFWFGPLAALRYGGRLVCRYWQEQPWFAALNMLIGLLTWSFFGGCVARLAALQFARDERATIGEAMKFTCRRYHSLVASPLALFFVVGVFALVVFLPAALVIWIPYVGELIAGVFFFVALLVSFVLSFLFLFAVSSLGLQMPAIAVEGRDAFDAISRGVNYVFSRPWRYIFYTAFSLIYLCLSFVLVRAFVYLMLKIPHAALSAFSFA
ncbi:MAG: hypothetical protein GWP05_10620, partial [Anaerolineaceae bacterium]|nr:hypothetical protein [Anaerolineaceae bacterium]